MAVERNDIGEWLDDTAKAQRTIAVDGTGAVVGNTVSVSNFPASTEIANDVGNPVPVSLPAGTQRTHVITRVTTATTTNITAGKRAYTIQVLAASSLTSPTVDGVAVPTGTILILSAPSGDTLDASAIVTLTGDDVLITTIA